MIRALLTVAAPVAVMALAAVPLAGAGLLSGPAGEPIMVAAAPGPLHRASFEGCVSSSTAADATRIVAFTLTGRDGGISVAVRQVPHGGSVAGATLVVLMDAEGNVVFAGDAADAGDCDDGAPTKPGSV
jgi:hypothetical protein